MNASMEQWWVEHQVVPWGRWFSVVNPVTGELVKADSEAQALALIEKYQVLKPGRYRTSRVLTMNR